MTRFAVKRLAPVEVDPARSNQHEFNAGLLRQALGISLDRVTGKLSTLYYESEEEPPTSAETTYTLYDARENTPKRREYRLYYKGPAIFERAHPGDLLVVFRASENSHDLHAIVAAQGTTMESEILRAMELDERASLEQYLRVVPDALEPVQGEQVALQLAYSHARRQGEYSTADHPTYKKAMVVREIPSTRTMAQAGRELAAEIHGAELDPDSFISTALEAETELFYRMEQEFRTPQLKKIISRPEVDLGDVLKFAKSVSQARASRRGASLEHHFGALLEREEIIFELHCETETGRYPDFVFPGCNAYHDPSFPTDRLRMVACKSTARERWPQILIEADRIRPKYFLTLDHSLSKDLVGRLAEKGLLLFLPRSVLQDYYPEAWRKGLAATVSDLVSSLADNQNGG